MLVIDFIENVSSLIRSKRTNKNNNYQIYFFSFCSSRRIRTLNNGAVSRHFIRLNYQGSCANNRTWTCTPLSEQRILSPPCLPFHHKGINDVEKHHLGDLVYTKFQVVEHCHRLSTSLLCSKGDSNPHALRHQFLRLACLPISPFEQLGCLVGNDPTTYGTTNHRSNQLSYRHHVLVRLSGNDPDLYLPKR